MFKLVMSCPAKEFVGRLTTHFDPPIILKGQWEVGIQHLSIDNSCKMLVLSDLVDFTMVGDKRMRLLDVYGCGKLTYVSVASKVISSINVDVIRYQDNLQLPEQTNDVFCVLHFRKS